MAKDIAQRMTYVHTAIRDLKISQHDPSGSGKLTEHFGFMKFDDNEITSASRLSEYIRLTLDTDSKAVVNFIRNGWRLQAPDLIISVTGGAKSFDMSTRLRKVFQRGLVSAAITTNAWLITAGTNAGVVKEVGEALNNYRYKNQKQGVDVPCIGIGSWGYTAGKEQLDSQPELPLINNNGIRLSSKTNQPQVIQAIRMDIGDQYCVRNYVVKEKPKKSCDLEPNHTHFLLFDDGQSSADSVIKLRAEIEKCARHIKTESTVEGVADTLIPIVIILVEGGPSSLETICQALEADTPVVVVKDSGRAADLVAELQACYSSNETGNGSAHPSRPQTGFARDGTRDNDFDAILARAKSSQAWVADIKKESWDILKKHMRRVTVFKFDSEKQHEHLENVILNALFKAAETSSINNEQSNRVAELKLATAWNKIDYAQKNLLTDTTISKWNEDDLRHSLVDSLRRGHREFVELLIEFGTSLEKLNHRDLDFLYQTTLATNRLPIKRIYKRAGKTKENFYSYYLKSIAAEQNMRPQPNLDDKLGKIASRELFFWAVFLDRFELATYFCTKTWNSSVAPLFGALVYRHAARLLLDSETKQQYEDNADKFDVHATLIIDRCFDVDENFAVDLIKSPALTFGNETPLEVARKANCRSFLASKTVQRYLDNEWFGYINYRRKSINFRIFLCTLFLPMLPIFCFFLPYVQKHKKATRSVRNRLQYSKPMQIHTVVEPDEKKGKYHVRWADRIVYFYEAPIVRFYYYMIFFVIFLGLYSYVLLVDYFPLNNNGGKRSGYSNIQIPITETILHICIWSLIIEEIRQFVSIESKRDYLSDVWNWMDIGAIVLYLIGFITRFFVSETIFAVSKIFLCLDLILWYIRTLNLFAAYEKLGPKLIMILNTMKDLLFFVCFILIFLLGFSITSWALLTTNDQITWNYNDDGALENYTLTDGGSGLWSWIILRNVTNYGIWKIFGQVDEIDGLDAYSAMAFILAILFVTIANVLLVNVLVALFNVTIQNVQNQSHRIWRYQRFVIIFEYCEKPLLPPPFNVFYHAFYGLLYLKSILFCVVKRHDNDRVNPYENTVYEDLKITDPMQRENAIADDYWVDTLRKGAKDPVEIKLQNIEREIHNLKQRLQNE